MNRDSIFNFGDLIFLLIREVLTLRVSINPSRGPLTVASLSGSSTALVSQPLVSHDNALFMPFTKITASPDSI